MTGRQGAHKVELTAHAERDLRGLAKRRPAAEIRQLQAALEDLAFDPLTKTEPLRGKLKGLRSRHAGRFRIVVKVSSRRVVVWVVGLGWHTSGDRDDIYAVLARAIERGIIDPDALG